MHGQHARYVPEFADIVQDLRCQTRPGDLVVTMGAGSVWRIGRSLVDG
jgi:UDP-N-acetylmuramate--alanine ligase